MTLKLTDKDFSEVKKVAEIIKEVDHSNISELVNSFEEIEKYQPFLISLLLGFKDQLNRIELDELANKLIIILPILEHKFLLVCRLSHHKLLFYHQAGHLL